MPNFDYVCPTCGCSEERTVSIALRDEQQCLVCGQMLQRQVAKPGVTFKGPGFYITDSTGSASASPA